MKTKYLTFLLVLLGYTHLFADNPIGGMCGLDLSWKVEKGVLIISGSGKMFDYDAEHLASWHVYNQRIKSVIIKDGITEIGCYAFYFCDKIERVTLPSTLNRIGAHSFMGCSSLQKMEIPSSLTIIEKSAFTYCHSLQSVSFPNHSLRIDNNAFSSCEKLKTVSLYSKENVSITAFDRNTSVSYRGNGNNQYLKTGSNSYSQPPLLTIIPNSTHFTEQSGNNIIDGNEACKLTFKVKNEGKGVAKHCVVKVRKSGTIYGILVDIPQIANIPAGQIQEITIPINSTRETKDGDVTFTVQVDEPNGFGTDPIEVNVKTRAYEAPFVQIVDYAVSESIGGQLKKKYPFNLQVILQNTKFGKAEDVVLEMMLPDNVMLLTGSKYIKLEELGGGEAKSIDYELVASSNYSSNNIPIQFKLREKFGVYSENKNISLQLNEALVSTKLDVAAIEAPKIEQRITIASIGSDVDKNIPKNKRQNENTFVVIIANEHYQQVASVPFAINDGLVFAKYCEVTFGIPSRNIHVVTDATINNIRQQVNWLQQVISVYDGEARIIFYYAGHGVPDEKSKNAYILPIDGNGSDITTGYKLDDLFYSLGSFPSKSVLIFLDACFSGSKREEGMLASARGVAIKAKSGQPIGNMVVLSAATGDETAYPNRDEGHGMFTYFLLKKLQETQGDVTIDELSSYVKKNVSRQSIILNGKSQTPTLSVSTEAHDWQNWKLNN